MLEKVRNLKTRLGEEVNSLQEYQMPLTSLRILKNHSVDPIGQSDVDAYLGGVQSPHFSDPFIKMRLNKNNLPHLSLRRTQEIHARSIAKRLALGHLPQEEWGKKPPDYEKVYSLFETLKEMNVPENNPYLIGLEKEADLLFKMACQTSLLSPLITE